MFLIGLLVGYLLGAAVMYYLVWVDNYNKKYLQEVNKKEGNK